LGSKISNWFSLLVCCRDFFGLKLCVALIDELIFWLLFLLIYFDQRRTSSSSCFLFLSLGCWGKRWERKLKIEMRGGKSFPIGGRCRGQEVSTTCVCCSGRRQNQEKNQNRKCCTDNLQHFRVLHFLKKKV
jgi:hypothetical protein